MEKKSSHIKKQRNSGKKNTCGQSYRSASTPNGPEKYNGYGGERESFRPSANEVYGPHENIKIYSTFEEDIVGMRGRNAQVKREGVELFNQYADLLMHNCEIDSLNFDLKNQVAKFESEMAVLVRKNESLEKKNVKFRTKNAELGMLQLDVKTRYTQLKDQLEEITKEKNDLDEQIEKLSVTKRFEEKCETLKKYNDKDITKMAVEINYSKTLLAEVQDTNSVLKQTNDLLCQRIKDLEKEVKSS